MAKVSITPVSTVTRGGYSAVITAIDPEDEDCLIGNADVPHGRKDQSWNDVGICRNSVESVNLDPSDTGVASAIKQVHSMRKQNKPQ